MAEKATSADLFVAMAWDIFFELDNCFVVCILFKIVLFCLQYVQFVFGEFSSFGGYSFVGASQKGPCPAIHSASPWLPALPSLHV